MSQPAPARPVLDHEYGKVTKEAGKPFMNSESVRFFTTIHPKDVAHKFSISYSVLIGRLLWLL